MSSRLGSIGMLNWGVIEPVRFNDPVKWCHRMVICPKKNGQLRRTIDLRNLNTYPTRDTQSPFYQVQAVPHIKKKQYLMPGMANTVSLFAKKTEHTPH